MAKKLLALIMALCLVFALAACNNGGNDDETTTAAADTAVNGETVAADETEAADATEAVSDDTTDVSEEASTEAATDAEGSTAAATEGATQAATATKKPSTTAEIVEYFNKASNQVKTNAKSVKHHYSKISLNGSTTLPGWADTVLKVLGGADKFINDQLVMNSKGESTYTGADIKAKYPVEGEAYASKLTAADVKSATCVEQNGQYIITIVTIADSKSSTVKHGQGHAPKAFNVVLPGVVNDNVPGVAKSMLGGDAEMNYPSSTAKITVDIATGRVVKADYDLKWTINFGTDIIIPFTTLDSYTISY